MSTGELLVRAWFSLGGFIVGYLTCWAIRRRVRGEHYPRASDVLRTIAGVVLIALVASTTVSAYSTTECQRRVNLEFRFGMVERSAAEMQGRQAQRDFLIAVATLPREALEERAAAYRKYLADLDSVDARLDAAKLPVLDCRG